MIYQVVVTHCQLMVMCYDDVTYQVVVTHYELVVICYNEMTYQVVVVTHCQLMACHLHFSSRYYMLLFTNNKTLTCDYVSQIFHYTMISSFWAVLQKVLTLVVGQILLHRDFFSVRHTRVFKLPIKITNHMHMPSTTSTSYLH